jgi:hypothetical protein
MATTTEVQSAPNKTKSIAGYQSEPGLLPEPRARANNLPITADHGNASISAK